MDSSIYELKGEALRDAMVELCRISAREARRVSHSKDSSSRDIAESVVPPVPTTEPEYRTVVVPYVAGDLHVQFRDEYYVVSQYGKVIERLGNLQIMLEKFENAVFDDHMLTALLDIKAAPLMVPVTIDDEPTVCESSTPGSPCGPVVTADSEGTPLCAACAWELDREVLKEIGEVVGYGAEFHDSLIDAVREMAAARKPIDLPPVQIVPLKGWYLVDKHSHVYKQTTKEVASSVASLMATQSPELGMFATQLYYLAAADAPSPRDPQATPNDNCRRCGKPRSEHLTSTDPAMRGWLFCDHNRLEAYSGPVAKP